MGKWPKWSEAGLCWSHRGPLHWTTSASGPGYGTLAASGSGMPEGLPSAPSHLLELLPPPYQSRMVLPPWAICAEGRARYGPDTPPSTEQVSTCESAAWTAPSKGESAAILDEIAELMADAVWAELASDLEPLRLVPDGDLTVTKAKAGKAKV